MNTTRPLSNDRRAFSLVEVMLAFLIFTFLSVAVLQSILSAARIAETTLRATVARNLAQSVLEQTRNIDFVTLRETNTRTFQDVFAAGRDIPLTRGTATAVTIDYRNTTAAEDDMNVLLTFNVVAQNPSRGQAVVVSVDYVWSRLAEGVGQPTGQGSLRYLRASF